MIQKHEEPINIILTSDTDTDLQYDIQYHHKDDLLEVVA